MKYISIGAVSSVSTEYILKIAHGGYTFQLDGVLAKLWLNGRSQFCTVTDPIDIKGLMQLLKMGLAVQAEECDAGEYRALTCCTIVPAECKFPFLFLSSTEKRVLTWLRGAGLVLSMAELTYLVEKDVDSEESLLGSSNAQALVERIYNKETIYDNILENQMEHARSREAVVSAIKKLLSKNRIVLL